MPKTCQTKSKHRKLTWEGEDAGWTGWFSCFLWFVTSAGGFPCEPVSVFPESAGKTLASDG
ncbi:hypothetical protein DPMN_140109 [Dreissena polymorpha]|uniref:Uncharacterized protein n=1 Tax=Dreissena polymorpha TaxID=45954 RepID=A0A9D4G9U9_DREPO|nr:hypothetical protein DPMN_140109 [Dreissena polymorpha]